MSLKPIQHKRYWAVALAFAVVISISTYFFMEWRRMNLIPVHRLSIEMFDKFNVAEPKSVGGVFEANETRVCALGEYGRKENLFKELNDAQRGSLTKLDVLSEEFTGHLLFFSDSSLKRAYLVENHTQFNLAADKTYCYGSRDTYSVMSTRLPHVEIRKLTFVSTKKED